MMRKLFCLSGIAAASLLAFSIPAHAQKDHKVEKTKEEIQQERMKRLITAFELYYEGREKNAPEYIITAAGMLRQLAALKDLQNMRKFDAHLEVTGPGKGDKEVTPATLLKRSDDWFDEANDTAATRGVKVEKLIELARERAAKEERELPEEQRAVIGGPRLAAMIIGPGQTHTYNYTIFTHGHTLWAFEANKRLRVIVTHTGSPNAVWFDKVTTFGTANWYPYGWNPKGYAKVGTAPISMRILNNLSVPAQYQMMIE